MLIDMHVHTMPHSEDSLLHTDEAIEQAKRVGLNGICITDHDWFYNPHDFEEVSKKHNFLVIPGSEISTEEAHFLVFGLDRWVFGMHRAHFVKGLLDEAGGAMIVAHPYRREFPWDDPDNSGFLRGLERACERPIFDMANAIEVLNGRGNAKENAFSLEVLRRLHLRGIAGSDSHELKDVGSCATEFERDIGNLGDLIAEIRAGRFRALDLRTNRYIF